LGIESGEKKKGRGRGGGERARGVERWKRVE